MDFEGKICIARYGKIFRGDKVSVFVKPFFICIVPFIVVLEKQNTCTSFRRKKNVLLHY